MLKLTIFIRFGNGKFQEAVDESSERSSSSPVVVTQIMGLSPGAQVIQCGFFGLADFLHKVSIAITRVVRHRHAFSVLAAEVINDY